MKKVLALVLAAMMVLSIAPVSFAAAKIPFSSIGWSASVPMNYYDVDVKVERDSKYTIEMPLVYVDGNGNTVPMTKNFVKQEKIDVKYKFREGSKVIDSVSIQYYKDDTAYVRVRFVDKFVSTGSQDFDFNVYLIANKKRIAGLEEIGFEGSLENQSQEAFEDYDYVYVYDIPVVEAKDYIKQTEIDLGNGVTIFAKLFEGKKYYGYATQKIKSEDDDVIAKYPAIGSVYYLDTIGLNSTGNYVKLDVSDKLFVYNSDLEYIGTTSDKLPYSTKYYVATEELDVDTAGDDVDEGPSDGDDTDDEPAANPDMGGDDVPENVNDNPGTGC